MFAGLADIILTFSLLSVKATNKTLRLVVWPIIASLSSFSECLISFSISWFSSWKTSSDSAGFILCFMRLLSTLPLSHSKMLTLDGLTTLYIYYMYIFLLSRLSGFYSRSMVILLYVRWL